jgi:hypothetical protein
MNSDLKLDVALKLLKVAGHQIQGTTWLLLYPNHTNPNSFAQTLRVFLPRLLRLLPRFEWLG